MLFIDLRTVGSVYDNLVKFMEITNQSNHRRFSEDVSGLESTRAEAMQLTSTAKDRR